MSRKPSRQLFAKKEDTKFQEALKLYEDKQYRKSLKIIEANLKKKPHAESFALKGLLLYHTEENDKDAPISTAAKRAYFGDELEMIRGECQSYFEKALKSNDDSPIVHHIIAIYCRLTAQYAEAAKHYRSAIDCGSANKNILKDLATCEAHLRNYNSLVSTRQELLDHMPEVRASWTGYAVANFLKQEYVVSEKTLAKFMSFYEANLKETDVYEHSETLLLTNRAIYKSGKVEEAVEHLAQKESMIVDKVKLLESKAQYLAHLGKLKEASVVYRQLVQRNPDNLSYYRELEKCLRVSSVEKKLKLYKKLETFYPRAEGPKVIPLLFLSHDAPEFTIILKKYVEAKLIKGVPSIFKSLKFLLKDAGKAKVLEKVITDFSESSEYGDNVWVWHLLAEYYLVAGNLENATTAVDKALAISEQIETGVLKARILKHQSKLAEAADFMNKTREKDLQDRFVNCKAVKYFLRANNESDAIKTASSFTKNDDAVNGLQDLHLMEANWYLIEEAETYFRHFVNAKNVFLSKVGVSEITEISIDDLKLYKEDLDKIRKYEGLCLKRYNAVVSIYREYYNDQYDFHSYCLNKGTLNAYLDLLSWEDDLYNQPLYLRAVKGLSNVYLNEHFNQASNSVIAKFFEALEKSKGKLKNKNKNKFTQQKQQEIDAVTAYKKDKDVFGEKFLTGDPVERLNESFSKVTDQTLLVAKKLSFFVNVAIFKYILALQVLKSSTIFSERAFLSYGLNLLYTEAQNNKVEKLKGINTVVLKSVEKSFPGFAEHSGSPNTVEDAFYYKKFAQLKKLDVQPDSSLQNSENLSFNDLFISNNGANEFYWV